MLDIFKSKEQRKAERRQKLREGKIRIQMAIKREAIIMQRLEGLARRALELDDEVQFKQLGKRLLSLRDSILQKERYILSIESLELHYDQSRASTEFLVALRSLGDTVLGMEDPANAAHLRREADDQLSKVQGMSERLDVLLELASDQLGPDPQEDARLAELEVSLRPDGTADNAVDGRLNAALKRVRQELRRQ